MSIVHECSAKNCRTLTMGQFCVEHEKTDVFEDLLAREVESCDAAGFAIRVGSRQAVSKEFA